MHHIFLYLRIPACSQALKSTYVRCNSCGNMLMFSEFVSLAIEGLQLGKLEEWCPMTFILDVDTYGLNHLYWFGKQF